MKRLFASLAIVAALIAIPGTVAGREAPTVVGLTEASPRPSVAPRPTPRPTPVVVGLPPVDPTPSPAPSRQPTPKRTLPPTDTE